MTFHLMVMLFIDIGRQMLENCDILIMLMLGKKYKKNSKIIWHS